MTEVFFRCTLLTDIVLNSKLATEGNMTTLNYIPGSNFLGIVAAGMYKSLKPAEAYSLFHSNHVSFGDAVISDGNRCSYQIPFNLMMAKGNETIGNHEVYLSHLLNEKNIPKDINGFELQLKQKRNGYFDSDGNLMPRIKKTFALKSAQDANERRSKEGAMFGFESLKKSQQFIFSIRFNDLTLKERVIDCLIGTRRVGKSKTAEFGQVNIEQITEAVKTVSLTENEDFTLVYAQSNCCFLNEYGQSTFQPNFKQLGLENGEVDFAKSQIRTYSYSPWNGTRNTTNSQRDCIAAGSVYYVKGKSKSGINIVGEYQSEGLGRVIVNPAFLHSENGSIKTTFFKAKTNTTATRTYSQPTTALGKFLLANQEAKKNELEISEAIQKAVSDSSTELKRISPSQWGGIRAYATNERHIDKLYKTLFDKQVGFLMHGVADEKYWGKQRGKFRIEFEAIFRNHYKYGTQFIAKYAAEMAKQSQKLQKEKEAQNVS